LLGITQASVIPSTLPMLEELNSSFVLLCGAAGFERAEVSSASGLAVDSSGVETILTRLQLSNHGLLVVRLKPDAT
jgi:hypothetical protein